MRYLAVSIILLVGLLLFGNQAYAELVGGKVLDINATTNTLTVSQTNLETGNQENISIRVKTEASFSGVASFAAIEVGDEIWAEAEEDQSTKNWMATFIQRIGSLAS